jgi:predicted cupin superfamily sugar epimerase
MQAPANLVAEPALDFVPCSIKLLPREQWVPAAATAARINPFNAPAISQLRQALPGQEPSPEFLAAVTTKYWGANGVNLTVSFLDNPPADLRARILSHMNAWAAFCNAHFVETTGTGQVRISRTPNDGYWSYLGTDILHIAANKPTMNLQSFSMSTPDSEFFRVVRHETGHTLGFPHEHRRKEIVDRIDPAAAKAYFLKYDGWSEQTTIEQVLTPIDQSALLATAHADPQSIMCYGLPASIMKDHVPVAGGADIDAQDAQFAATVYPIPNPAQTSKNSPALAAFNNRLWDCFVANNSSNSVLICSSANGATWTDNTRLNQAAQGGTAPALAAFNGQLWACFVANNSSNDILICSSPNGLAWSNNTRLNQAGKGNSSPALAIFNGRLWVAFIANNNSNDVLVCSSADGHTWTNNTRVGQAARGGTSPTLAVFNNQLWVAFIANNNSNDVLICSSANGATWTNNTRLNQSGRTGSSPSLAVFNNQLWVAFIANNNSNDVLVCSSADGHAWSGNTRLNQSARSNTSPALAVFANRLWASFIANNDTQTVLVSSSPDGHSWSGNTVV